MEFDDPRWNIDDAAAIAGIDPKRIRVLVRAGAPIVDPKQPPRSRYNETDIRTIAVCSAIMDEFDLSAPDAVAHWMSLTPDGAWPKGSEHIVFLIDGEPCARLYPGAIAARISRRILAKDVADHYAALRLAGAGDVASSGVDYPDAVRAPRIALPASPRQTPGSVTIPASKFHPARLRRASTKEST